jgi:hypothetical protein
MRPANLQQEIPKIVAVDLGEICHE